MNKKITEVDIVLAVQHLWRMSGNPDIQDIASHLGCSVGTVRARIREAGGNITGIEKIDGFRGNKRVIRYRPTIGLLKSWISLLMHGLEQADRGFDCIEQQLAIGHIEVVPGKNIESVRAFITDLLRKSK